ncbi:MAG: ComEC family competence protein [Bacteroidales bacterium]|jgi:competence protein ComEC|nr:ComEC family competence protein [Bacteroidales bacterium]
MNDVNILRQIPFARFLPPFIAGIIVAGYVSVPAETLLFACVPLFFALCGLHLKWGKIAGWAEWAFRWILRLFLFAAGVAVMSAQPFVPEKNEEQGLYMVVVEEAPVERAASVRIEAGTRAYGNAASWESRNERVMLYIGKDSASLTLRQGDLLAVSATLQPVENMGNLHEFDYQTYLKWKRIGRNAYVETGKWRLLQHDAQSLPVNVINRIRHYLLEVFRKTALSGNELAVASALTIGYKAYLDNELKTAYAASGAMHVLAVSGLHVGILYCMLLLLLEHIPFLRHRKMWTLVIILSVIWLYVLVTGMSPSVVRSALMFSLIATGKTFLRKPFIYNNITASAFIILLLRPTDLFNIGFQLSYTAVIAIVFFFSRFHALLHFKNHFVNNVWELSCVSIAAQIGTAPLSLYYFHQFPNYFLLTNFVVIPAASIIIYAAVSMFVLSPTILTEYIGWLLDKFLYALNSVIFFIEKLPGSLLENIRIHAWDVALFYAVIAAVSAWIVTTRKYCLALTLFLCWIWAMLSAVYGYRDADRRQLIVYHVQGNSLLQLVHSGQDIIWYGGNPSFQPVSFTARHRIAVQSENILSEPMDSAFAYTGKPPLPDLYMSENFFGFAGKRIAVFTPNHPPERNDLRKADVDIAILTRNVRTEIDDVIRFCSPEIIVVDASNSSARSAKWEQDCIRTNVSYHNVASSGAFVVEK